MIENLEKCQEGGFPHPDELFHNELRKVKEQIAEEKAVSAPKVEVARLFTTPIIVVLVCVALFFSVCNLFHIRFYYMTTGSMDRIIPKGSVIVSKEVDVEELAVGDIITYKNKDGILVTHVIVTKRRDDFGQYTAFQTKGTENPVVDAQEVTGDIIESKVLFHIPIFFLKE